jgi:hypothetical protein
VFRSVKAKSVLFGAILLTLVTPAAIDAGGHSSMVLTPSATPSNTPLGRNLLRNASFEALTGDTPIPSWSVSGAMHLERFGTRTWPDPAYSKKYNGGNDYLACSRGEGTIHQSVRWTGWRPRDYILKSRFWANFGGTIGNRIRATVKMIDRAKGHSAVSRQRTRTLDIQNSYKRLVVTLMVPAWADSIEVTLQMMPKAGSSRCDVVADSLNLSVFRP